jgi:hypothetical protein
MLQSFVFECLKDSLSKCKSDNDLLNLGAVKLGAGVQKTAYLLCGLVVKENTGAWNNGKTEFPELLTKSNFRAPRNVVVDVVDAQGMDVRQWVIQEYVKPAKDAWNSYSEVQRNMAEAMARECIEWDVHAGNFGIAEDGSYVCFDF